MTQMGASVRKSLIQKLSPAEVDTAVCVIMYASYAVITQHSHYSPRIMVQSINRVIHNFLG